MATRLHDVYGVTAVPSGFAVQSPGADGAVKREFAFVRRLHGGNHARFSSGNFHELLRAGLRAARDVEMIADEQQERFSAGETVRALDRVAVAKRRGLLDKLQARGVCAGSGREGLLITGANHHADLLDAGVQDFLDDDGQRGLRLAVMVHERLQRQRALPAPGGSDDGFAEVHNSSMRRCAAAARLRRLRRMEEKSERHGGPDGREHWDEE